MKIMSVDYGDARTGIAFCDENEILATAYGVIKEDYAPKLADKIKAVAKRENAQMIVVGMPRNMDGSYGFRAEKCRDFGKLLSDLTSLPVEFEDERLTTVMAHGILSGNNIKAVKHKENVDAVSAVLILQSFIDKRKNNR